MANEWHGYPQHPDAHPERPWWRLVSRYNEPTLWVRHDNVKAGTRWSVDAWRQARPAWLLTVRGEASWHQEPVDIDALAEYDAAHPLPPPEPRCGQVWVWPSRAERTVVNVIDGRAVFMGQTFSHGMDQALVAPLLFEHDLAGAVLVSGPGAPWAPMGDTDG